MFRAIAVGTVAALLVGSAALAGGRLTGTVWREDGRDVWMADMVAFQSGETQGVVEGWATSNYAYGDIAAGTYCLFNDNAWAHMAFWRDGVEVVDSQTHHRDIRVRGLAYLGKSQEMWPEAWPREFGQTFVATGTSITQANIKIAAIERDLLVSILEGGPGGTQLGPERALYLGRDKSGSAYWVHGDVPTIPGKRYYIKVVSPWGSYCQTWMSKADRQTYPYGQAWSDGVPEPDRDISGFAINDTDGLISTLAPVDYGNYMYYPEPPVEVVMTQYAAQTFTAKGAMVVGASCPIKYASGLSAMKFTIREGGPDGSQVGPAKTVSVSTGDTARGAWREGELPVTAGNTYTLRAEPVPAATAVTVWKMREQHDTSMWLDGVEITDGDFQCKVFEYDGYDPLTISNIRITPDGPGSATVSWDTDAAATSQLEYRSVQVPIDNLTELDETLVTEHAVLLSGLTPGHTYEFVCKSYAAGYRWAVAPAVSVSVDEPAEFAWTLDDGWNLVGLTDADVPIADCRLDDGVEEKLWDDAVVAGWVQDSAFYYTGTSYGVAKSSGGDDDRIRRALGYWILNESGGSLSMLVP